MGEHKAFVLALLVFLNPGQFIFQFGFQPSPVAFACTALAILYLYAAIDQNRLSFYYWSGLLLIFSTLIRTTHIMFLGAMGVVLIYHLLKGDKTVVKPLIFSVVGGFLIVGYFMYNRYLRQEYGSIFLGGTMFPRNIRDFILSGYMVVRRFSYYLPIPLIILMFWKFVEFRFSRKRIDVKAFKVSLKVFLLAAFGAIFIFYIVMLQQFVHHDYYLLDTMSPLFFALVLSLFSLKDISFTNKQIVVFVVLMLGLGVSKLWRTVDASKDSRAYQTSLNFEGASEVLEELSIGRSDKILVIDAYAPNLPFIHLQRQGYLVLTTSKENIERALTWPFDYVVTQNRFFESDVLINFPEFAQYVSPIKDNGRITIWDLSPKGREIYPPKYKPESVRW